MLTELSIANLAVVSKSVCEFHTGLSVVTGETGAGKSMLVDALSWIMGARASLDMIREQATQAEVSARFDVSERPEAKAWLQENDLAEENECLIRRIVAKDGRSRAYVNEKPVTLQALRTLSDFLINIHSQHQNLALLKSDYQLMLLDSFGEHDDLLAALKTAYTDWHQAVADLEALIAAEKASAEKQALIAYQYEELHQLKLNETEWETLNAQQKRLAHAASHVSLTEEALFLLDQDESGILRQLNLLHQKMIEAAKMNPAFQTAETIFAQALLTLTEARSELTHLSNQTDQDPERLIEIERRLSQLFDAARKHKVRPEELYQYYMNLKNQLSAINLFETQKEAAMRALEHTKAAYDTLAQELTKKRMATAKKLTHAVSEMLPTVALQHANFEIALETNDHEPRVNGVDRIEFLIATGPQQSKSPLAKVVSGGELSRISLIIQVLTKGHKHPPCLVFDEVDTGISGHTASVVGKLLQKLSANTQIICITHLPQVAALGTHHYAVSKTILKDAVESKIEKLDENARLAALAALLGGLSSKEAAHAHAKALREEALI